MSAECCGGEVDPGAKTRKTVLDSASELVAADSELVAAEEDDEKRYWWRDSEIMLPVLSGVCFIVALIFERSGAEPSAELTATILFWIGLLLGAVTFVPGAIRRLLRGKLGIALLMTISAVGAVLLGYVQEAAALAFLYSIAEALEDKAMDRARSGLRSLLRLVPDTATILNRGTAALVPVKQLNLGDLMLVRAGSRIATDGVVRAGLSSVDTSAITGESIPVAVSAGDAVPAGSINGAGVLEVEATSNGIDNSLTKIVALVQQAQAKKGQRGRLADRIAKPLVPGVIVLAILVAALGSVFGNPEIWITRALVVLVAASPCAIAIAVPITVISAIGAATKFGVVIKSGAAFEEFGRIKAVAFDKTGTLTRNQPTVTEVLATSSATAAEVIALAAALEQHSTHPLAKAITDAAPEHTPVTEITELPGQGIRGLVDGVQVLLGSPRWIEPGSLQGEVERLESAGATVVLVARAGVSIGLIAVRDELRTEAWAAAAKLSEQGLRLAMLTGDNARTADAIAGQAGISDVRAELTPSGKAAAIAQLQQHGLVAMIGDGINDAPALASADVGIAMGATGADAAVESADVAFVGHDLRLIPQAFRHAKRGRRIIDQNILLSLLIILVLVPLAAVGALGLAAVVFVHEIAEIFVILNGLRAGVVPRFARSST